MDTLVPAPPQRHRSPRPQRMRRVLASGLAATLFSSGLVGVMASAAHAETQSVETPDGAVLIAPTEVEHGEEIVISGENWFGQDGESPSVGAVLLDAPAPGAVNTTREVINPVTGEPTADTRLHAIFEAEDDGSWEVSIPFPDEDNSDIDPQDWDAETEHLVRVLSGSLGDNDVIRNPHAEFTVVAAEEEELTAVSPQEPAREGNTVTVPEVEGVTYSHQGQVEIPEGGTLEITAEAAADYVLTEDAVTSWSFDYEADDDEEDDVEEPTRAYNDGAEVWIPEQWEYGESLDIRGEGWVNFDGDAGSVIAVRLDGDGGPTPEVTPHPLADGLDGVWEIIEADEDGSFDVSLDFPTPYNSDLEEPWQTGSEHEIILLTGSLGENDVARGGAAGTVTITGEAPAMIESDLDYEVDRLDTGVNNGYQLALDEVNRSVYLADTQWRQETRGEDGEITVRESSSKLVEFDVDSKELVRNHDFTGLTLNDGSGTESDPLDWSEAGEDVTSLSTIRTHFGPYGVAVDTSSNSVITTTARQRNGYADYGYGGGVVLYSADQGEPTDGDRIWAYEDDEPVFDGPRRVAVNPETNRAYVTNLGDGRFGSVSGPDARHGYITVLDTTKRGLDAVVAQVAIPKTADQTPLGVVGVDVDADHNNIYVGTMGAGDGSLWVIDGDAVEESDPTSTSKTESQQANAGAVTELDATVGLNARPTYDPVDKRVYVSAWNDETITVVDGDPASSNYGEAIEVIETGSTNSVSIDGERGLLYSANLGDREVVVYDTEDFEPQLVLPTSGNAINIGIDPVSRDLWVSNFSNAGVVDVFSITGDDFDGGGTVDPPAPVDPEEPEPTDEPTEPEPTEPAPSPSPSDDASTPPSGDDDDPAPSPSPSDDATTPPSDDDEDQDGDDDQVGDAEITLSVSEIAAGGEVDFEASGFDAEDQVTVTLNPTLGTFEADAEGSVSGTVTIPEDQEPGDYEFTATGDSGITASTTLTVVAADPGPAEEPDDDTKQQPGGLAQTGATIGLVGLGALVLLAIGFGVLAMVRRRSSFEA
ncbi:YncE family protein [Nesterenkonia muleiensis]|uniref:YncE family protein n=1 Tax=Nesterenkonia muleiensis TaxID=2282648 RepID=UPI001300598B|nr:hypothetical protein [Nesterenkonia muleiensis]